MWQLADQTFSSRLLLGTAQYPSLAILQQAILESGTQIITVSLCRQNPMGNSSVAASENTFWQQLQSLGCSVLPNTAGCRNARDAVAMAEIAREIFQTNWIKLEVIGDDYTLQPDPFELLTAARQLVKAGFVVFPYCTEDLVLCRHLYDSGCQILMPWAAPIGSGKGLLNPYALDVLRNRLPDATLIIDAGIGKPSHAAQVMELGFDGVLLNTAVALAQDPVQLAKAFRDAIASGRAAYTGGVITERNYARPSTALLDTPFWQQIDNTSTLSDSEKNAIPPKKETLSNPINYSVEDQPPPIVWTIAGSDSGGGAGIQADLHTFHALGAHGCSVITAVTAQNSVSVGDIHDIPASTVLKQIALLAQDLPAQAIKLGLLGNREASEGILRFLQNYSGAVVLDPVMIASSGNPLFAIELAEHIQRLRDLMPLASVITPNLPEAEALVGHPIHSHDDMKQAAQTLLEWGARSVLIKGGHFREDPLSQDYWTDGKDSFWLIGVRRVGRSYHGGGCTLSSAIAATLALGYPLKDALVLAKMYYHQGIQGTHQLGSGAASVRHTHWPKGAEHLPFLSMNPLETLPMAFPDCGSEPLGLYPVVDSVEWVERLLPLGVKTIQLRIKTGDQSSISEQIQRAVTLAKQHGARLFINDYWELAIEHGAYGVHLGQEDLQTADLNRIQTAGLRLGVSTHSYAELARAHTCQPSYIALGPIYPTTSKIMPFAPQGLTNVHRWRDLLRCPLVVIGGIQADHIPTLLGAGADGIAMISAITQAADPVSTVHQMLKHFG